MEGSLKELTTLLYNEAQMVYKHNFIDYLKKLCAINYHVYSNRTQAKKKNNNFCLVSDKGCQLLHYENPRI